MAFDLPDLPYGFNELEPFIDEMTMKIHHDKHHAAYVENLNKSLEGHPELNSVDIKDLLRKLDKVPEEIRTKVRNNGGGHANHSFFWEVMRPAKSGATVPTGNLLTAINSEFGDFNTFQENFLESALGRFGSGWVWLVSNRGKLSIVDTPNQDTPLMDRKPAILGLDVWEHAYYLNYQNKRADYVKAWWNVVNWQKVNIHFQNSI